MKQKTKSALKKRIVRTKGGKGKMMRWLLNKVRRVPVSPSDCKRMKKLVS